MKGSGNVVKITKRFVDSDRTLPGDQDRFFWDTELKGFGLKVTPKGRKIYVLKYRMGGRATPTRRYTIGEHGGDLPPDKARSKAERLRGKIRDGIDPMAEKKTAPRAAGGITIDGLIDEYLERWARPKKRSAAEDERMLKRELLGKTVGGEEIEEIRPVDTWRSRPIASVVRRDIVELLDRIVDRGSPIQANRTLATVRRMFNFAIERGLLEASPCVKIRAPGKETARDRALSANEIAAFWKVLESAPMEDNMRRGFRFMLATGQRKGEVFGLNKTEISAEEKTWLIPAARAKNGREHLVPLSPIALEIFEEMRAVKGGWLLASERTDKPYRMQTPDHVMRELFITRKRRSPRGSAVEPKRPALADLEPFTPHDLRRTVATNMRELGITREDVSLVLNHKARDVTGKHYDRYDGLREKRRALEVWSSYLTSIIRPARSNVTTLATTQSA